MSSDERIRNRRHFRNPMLIIGITMTVFYFCFGTYLLVSADALPNVPVEFRNIFASMLLIYGSYRGWRIYQDYF